MTERSEKDFNRQALHGPEHDGEPMDGFAAPEGSRTPEPTVSIRANLSTIGEPSFADAIAAIGEDPTLSKSVRVHWSTSLRRIAEFIGRPPECIAARLTAVRQTINSLNPANLGVSPKTLSNHRSNVVAALNHLANKGWTVPRGIPLSVEWRSLIDAVDTKKFRIALMTFGRYCSGQGIAPSAVAKEMVDAFFHHREQTTLLENTLGRRRALARAWNHAKSTVEGWPRIELPVEPLPSAHSGPAWTEFPEHLRAEIEAYLAGHTRMHRGPSGKRFGPNKASTLSTRRRELEAYVRKAVASGIPIDELSSLRDLLRPETVKRVLGAYWPDEHLPPRGYVIDLATKLWTMARETGCLSDDELAELDDIQASLTKYRRKGLTPKNMNVVRRVIGSDAWSRVIQLPDTLMEQARAKRAHSPVRAAVEAGIAVAIKILVYAPVRVGNLAAIRLDENLIRPGGPGAPFTLIFDEYDVKNRVPLEFPLDANLTAMIDEYVHCFRPALMRGHNSDWLFPSENGRHKGSATLSNQICQQVKHHVGFPVTAHQFRHAAAAIILKSRPGEFELVRRVLGHTSIHTTINFYVGLESVWASQTFGEIVNREIAQHSEDGDDDE